MPRLFLPIFDYNQYITIKGEKAHYLINVLRLRQGNQFDAINGKGKCFVLTIKEISKNKVICEIKNISECNLESQIFLTLAQGILKGYKMDLVIQKATELGVNEIVPIITERSQIKHTRKLQRWQKIVEEASKQSGRSTIPIIHKAINFYNFIDNFKPNVGLIFYEKEGKSLKEVSPKINENKIILIIGPEGGFTEEEVNYAIQNDFTPISLGKRILRAETASISAITLLQFLLGDMG